MSASPVRERTLRLLAFHVSVVFQISQETVGITRVCHDGLFDNERRSLALPFNLRLRHCLLKILNPGVGDRRAFEVQLFEIGQSF